MTSVHNVTQYKFSPVDQVLVDANVLLLIFCAHANVGQEERT